MATRVVVVSAGLRSPSSTKLLADQIGEELHARLLKDPSGVEIAQIEVRTHAHAIADALLTGFATGELKSDLTSVAEADALVLVSPTFQASYSGLFKSFIDLIDADDVRGKPVILAATGGSERHSLVLDHALRPLAAYLGLVVVPTGIFAATSDFGGEGTGALTARIERAANELARLIPDMAPVQAVPDPRGDESPVTGAPVSGAPVSGGPNFVNFEELLRAVGQ